MVWVLKGVLFIWAKWVDVDFWLHMGYVTLVSWRSLFLWHYAARGHSIKTKLNMLVECCVEGQRGGGQGLPLSCLMPESLLQCLTLCRVNIWSRTRLCCDPEPFTDGGRAHLCFPHMTLFVVVHHNTSICHLIWSLSPLGKPTKKRRTV